MLTYHNFTYATPHDPKWRRVLIKAIEFLSGKLSLWKIYQDFQEEYQPQQETLWSVGLRKLDITLDYDHEKLAKIPKTGSLVIVANHPYGVLDGLAIGALIEKVRDDYKIITNSVLCQAEEVKDYMLPVDFDATKEALKTNLKNRKAARTVLDQGGCLVIFPARGVSNVQSIRTWQAIDRMWQPFIGSLIMRTKPKVVPVFFSGQNSWKFQLASLYSQTLRLAFFFHEVYRRKDSQLKCHIGDVMRASSWQHIDDREDLCAFLRRETYRLGGFEDIDPGQPAFRIEAPAKGLAKDVLKNEH